MLLKLQRRLPRATRGPFSLGSRTACVPTFLDSTTLAHGLGMGLLPLRDGLDGLTSSMPSSELCTGLYCTMGYGVTAAAVFYGRSWLFSTAAAAPASSGSGQLRVTDAPLSASTGGLVIKDHRAYEHDSRRSSRRVAARTAKCS